jgi:hypothetical protein
MVAFQFLVAFDLGKLKIGNADPPQADDDYPACLQAEMSAARFSLRSKKRLRQDKD